jgi:23S rRNA (pseudouridine1915-N3)-methyltransferase
LFRVTLSVSGRLNEPFWRDAAREYEKRLSAWCKLAALEAPEPKPPAVPKADKLVALCVEGRPLSSEAFAQTLRDWQNAGVSHAAFLIGGSDGLPETLKAGADERLSLSQMTFPHAAARVLLLEQLYRAFSILNGGKYHK